LKICYLANAQSIHTQRWARHFAGQGNQVSVVSFDPGSIEGAEVIALPRVASDMRWNVLFNIFNVRRLVDDIRPDILHAHYVKSYGLVGALTGKHPYVATAWGSDVLIEPERSWIYRQMVRFNLRRADLITSMAPHMTDLLVKRRYAAIDKIIDLPFGVDTNVFNPDKRTRQHEHQPAIVVSTRRLDYGMDVDTFVKAIPLVLKAFDNIKFIITGEGPLRQSVEQLAGKLGVSGHIEFWGDIDHKEMPKLLGMADVFVSTSPSDGNNISLNEAMACGAFPVVTDITANRAWIEPGKNGLLYPCRKVDQLSDRIIEALRRPDWRRAVIPHNWDIIREKASWSHSMTIMESHYNRLYREMSA
jgi:glycosyltransferase involved in cell wall biosynthesis